MFAINNMFLSVTSFDTATSPRGVVRALLTRVPLVQEIMVVVETPDLFLFAQLGLVVVRTMERRICQQY